MDLLCGDGIESTAVNLVRGWGRDRALPSTAVDRLGVLVSAAVGHGLRFGPRGVTIGMRWLDAHRVQINVRWRGCSGATRSSGPAHDVEQTAAALDANAERWGFGASTTDPLHWIVLDTR